jgi:hypothetical protein
LPSPYICSFCRRDTRPNLRCIAGPNGVYICEECARKAVAIFDEPSQPSTTTTYYALEFRRPATEEDLKELLESISRNRHPARSSQD